MSCISDFADDAVFAHNRRGKDNECRSKCLPSTVIFYVNVLHSCGNSSPLLASDLAFADYCTRL